MNCFPGRKVLVLDGSHLLLNALKTALQARQCLVETETGAVSALLRTIRWHPDLLITGVEVGEMTGFDLCLVLKLMPDYAGMPVVVMSSSEGELMARKVADAGGDFYVPKDARLIPAVARILGKLFPGTEPAPPAPTLPRPVRRILVVDDSKVMRRVIRNILSSLGMNEVVEAANGLEALERMKETPADLVLTDWNMPVMSGLEFVQKTRAQSRFAKVPIVMVTTEGSRDAIAEARAAGVNEHLCKPFSSESMKALLARFTAAT